MGSLGLKAIFLSLVISLTVIDPSIVAAEDCNGRGHKGDDGVCVCDNAWPEVGGSGWVGEDCQVPVFGSSGTDLTSSCAAHECNSLEENTWSCFTVLPESEAWNFFSIYLNRTGGEGDPDLYGFGKAASPAPNFSAASGFAFQDTSTGATIRTLAKKDNEEALFSQGTYLCVHNYGPGALKFDLLATLDPCPSSFTAEGTPLMCHTPKDASESERRFTECSAAGECMCKDPYTRPVPGVFSGLGFEDCSAQTEMISDEQASSDKPFVAEDEIVEAASWKFYGFNITGEDFEVVATVAEKSGGRVEIFAKAGAPPGAAAGQFDSRADWNPAPGERLHRIVLGGAHAASELRTGLWFVGVFGAASGGSYELGLQKLACPGNCSSNGVCDASTHTCTCSEGFGGVDCSIYSNQLTYNSTIERNTSAAFELEYYDMPPVTDAMLQGNVEVVVKATCSSNRYNPHVTARPAVFFLTDGSGEYPSPRNFTQRLVLDLDREHTITFCTSQLQKGDWKMAVYNPLPSLPLNYTLSIDKVGRCLNECSGHGECSSDGLCECSSGFAGGDCSVESGGGGGGGKKPKHHGGLMFFSTLFWIAIGAAGAFAYVSYRGVPRWLPLKYGAGGFGIYQELTEDEGI